MISYTSHGTRSVLLDLPIGMAVLLIALSLEEVHRGIGIEHALDQCLLRRRDRLWEDRNRFRAGSFDAASKFTKIVRSNGNVGVFILIICQ
jgi:hypothetical protein